MKDPPIEQAELRFVTIKDRQWGLTFLLGYGRFEGRLVVGQGQDRKEAVFDVMHNAYPDKRMVLAPNVAMELGKIK